MPTRHRAAALALAAAAVTAIVTASAAPASAAPASAASAVGTVLGWGTGTGGQLGDDATASSATPVPVSLAGVTVTSVAAGATHTLAVTAAGSLLAWGTNSSGQLGSGTQTSTDAPAPVQHLPDGTTITQAAAGDQFSLALTAGGSVLAWGANSSGQLGDGTGTTRLLPVPVDLNGATVTQISAGTAFSLALTSAGTVLAWGGNRDGELGNLSGNSSSTPEPVPFPVPAGVRAVQVAAGGNFGLALMSDGDVFAWGDGADGQLGDNSTASSAPVLVGLPGSAAAIAAGGSTGYALTSAGSTDFAWGDGAQGQLGNGTAASSNVPVLITRPGNVALTALSAGAQSAAAIDSAGHVLTWGTGATGTGAPSSDLPAAVSLGASQVPAGLSAGPDAAAAFAIVTPATVTSPAEPVLQCQVIAVGTGASAGLQPSPCRPSQAASQYVIDTEAAGASGPVTWTAPAGVTVIGGCQPTSAFCDVSVRGTASSQDFTTTAATRDPAGTPVSLTAVADLPAVCGVTFCQPPL